VGLKRFWYLGFGSAWWSRGCLLLPVVVSVPPLKVGVDVRSPVCALGVPSR